MHKEEAVQDRARINRDMVGDVEMQPGLIPSEEWWPRVTIHEAGHAVIGHHLGLLITRIHIQPGPGSPREVRFKNPFNDYTSWDAIRENPLAYSHYKRLGYTYHAGPLAEYKSLGTFNETGNQDLPIAAETYRELELDVVVARQ